MHACKGGHLEVVEYLHEAGGKKLAGDTILLFFKQCVSFSPKNIDPVCIHTPCFFNINSADTVDAMLAC
jgi:hypothetical protein